MIVDIWIILACVLFFVPNLVFVMLSIYFSLCSNIDQENQPLLQNRASLMLQYAAPLYSQWIVVHFVGWVIYAIIVSFVKKDSWLVKSASKIAEKLPEYTPSRGCSCM